MISRKGVNTLLLSAVALTLAGGAGMASAADAPTTEKCYGVAKAGMNDCANAMKTHSCASHATTDGDKGDFVLLPKGACEKIVNGSTTPPEAK